jgi:hypothetical protein
MISDAAKKLGEALVSAKVLTREQLSSTLARAEKNNSSKKCDCWRQKYFTDDTGAYSKENHNRKFYFPH